MSEFEADRSLTFQAKGTNFCLDFCCPVCGDRHHIDGDFIYAIKCTCGAMFKLYDEIKIERIDEPTGCMHDLNDGFSKPRCSCGELKVIDQDGNWFCLVHWDEK